MAALGSRRLAASGIDYLIVAAYAGVVFGLMYAIHGAEGLAELGEHYNPIKAQAISFFVMTLPVALYFAILESRSRSATVGKRVVGLQVVLVDGGRATFGRTLARAAVKFLPWEIGHLFAHSFIAHGDRMPDAPLPIWLWVAFALSMGGALFYAASLFIGAGATPYDHATRTRVVIDHATGTRVVVGGGSRD